MLGNLHKSDTSGNKMKFVDKFIGVLKRIKNSLFPLCYAPFFLSP